MSPLPNGHSRILQAGEGRSPGPKCGDSEVHCDVDKCVNSDQICDGTAQCDSGVDEAAGFCSE